MAQLLARGIWAGYGAQPVLAGVDVTLGPGDAVGVIGRSGIGKSTLVEVLAGRIAPVRGLVTFNGSKVFKPSRGDKKGLKARLRVVHQNGHDAADPMITVEKAVKGVLDDARAAGRSTGRDVEAALVDMELPRNLLTRRIGTLSGGERQRLALSLALATRPDILLLDEPLTAIDQKTRHRLADALANRLAADGAGLLLASHDVRLVEQLTRTVHVLADGVFVESGSLAQVLAHPQHPDTKDFVAALPAATLRWG
ncbi:MAG: ATP-binding cassette domain-containing protein [Micrococcales bacterium]|nr:ATP-binding cassette domain-containing protein [Micrococcales bacterium]